LREWFELSEAEFSELLRVQGVFRREAVRCAAAKAYVAACAMYGAALEASLVAMCHLYPEDVTQGRSDSRLRPLLRLSFAELIRAAITAGWLPSRLNPGESFDTSRAHIGDWAGVLKDFRNLVHAGRYVEDLPGGRISKQRMERCREILEVASDHLLAKVYESLRRTLQPRNQRLNPSG
jgi:hypothetical protein